MVAISGTSWFTLAATATALFATVTDAHLSMTVSKADVRKQESILNAV